MDWHPVHVPRLDTYRQGCTTRELSNHRRITGPKETDVFLDGMTPMLHNTPQDIAIVTMDSSSYLEGVLL